MSRKQGSKHVRQHSKSRDNLKTNAVKSDHTGATNSTDAGSDEISLWLAGSVAFSLILVFVIAGFIVQKAYFQPSIARTAVERDLMKYKDAIRSNPDDPEAHIGLAATYLDIQQPKNAIRELERAIKLKPDSWAAHFELGVAYSALTDFENSVKHFSKAASIDPGNELAFYQLGRLYLEQKLYGQAIQAFNESLKINPTLADARYYLGLCYEKTGKKELAKKEYREALRYIKNYPEAEKALKRLD